MESFIPKIEQIAGWGTEELWVVRLEIGLREIVKDLRDSGEELEDLLWIYQQITDEMTNAFIALRRIRKGGMLQLEESKEYSNLYGHLWAAYKDRLDTFMKKLGYPVGFIYKPNDEGFSVAANAHCKKFNIPDDFINAVAHDRANWQHKLASIRNDYNEHRKLPYDVDEKYFKVEAAQTFFDNVWMAIEDIIAIHAQAEYARVSKTLTIYEIPEEARDVNMPLRFRVNLTPEVLNKLPLTKHRSDRS